jgi:hypothetical protein
MASSPDPPLGAGHVEKATADSGGSTEDAAQ